MNPTTAAIDLAKDAFELGLADDHARILQRKRLTRAKLIPELGNRAPMVVIMEACSTAHHWARRLAAMAHTPVLHRPSTPGRSSASPPSAAPRAMC